MITAKYVPYSLLNYSKKQPTTWDYIIGPWVVKAVPKHLKDEFKSIEVFKKILTIYRYLLKMSDESIVKVCRDCVIDENPWTAANLLLANFPEIEEHDGKLVVKWECKKAREMYTAKNMFYYTPWISEGGL